jgi:hypothetical protein
MSARTVDQMSDTARYWWRVSAAVIVAVVGVSLGLHEIGTWTLPGWLAAGLLIAGALVAFVTAAEAAVDQRRHGRVAELREQARAVLAPLLLELEEATRINARQLGVAAYRVRKPAGPFGKERLERLLRLQLVIRVASGIVWRPGVGVIGQCVVRGEDVVENLATLDEQLAGVSPADWESLGDDLTYGFSYAEFQRVRGKYGVVLASPMIKETPLGSRVVGCISVDGPPGSFQALASEEIRGFVAAAAVTLAAVVAG